MKKLSFIFSVLFAVCGIHPELAHAQYRTPYAQTVDIQRDTMSLMVYFRQGISSLELDFMDNRANLEDFAWRLNHLGQNTAIDTLKISGSASPEGNLEFNESLARGRAEAIRNYVSVRTGISQSRIVLDPRGENWSGLEEKLEGCNMPWAEEALSIVRGGPLYVDVKNGTKVDDRKRQLQQLDGGEAWRWMLDNIFPELRCSAGGITCVLSVQRESRRDTVFVYHRDTVVIINENITRIEQDRKPRRQAPDRGPWWEETDDGRQFVRKPVVALRTNLFLPALNVGMELPLGNRWSLEWDHYYPWVWRNPDHRNCIQAIGEFAGIRFWFGDTHRKGIWNAKYRLTGHSIAAIGAVGYYDFEKDFDGFRGEYWAAGLDYTYAMPIAKGKMRLEFDVAAGYFQTFSKPYDVFTEGGYLIHRNGLVNNTTWFGPIKAGINLVIPICRKVWLGEGDVEKYTQKMEERWR